MEHREYESKQVHMVPGLGLTGDLPVCNIQYVFLTKK